jgi:hypothetical protein
MTPDSNPGYTHPVREPAARTGEQRWGTLIKIPMETKKFASVPASKEREIQKIVTTLEVISHVTGYTFSFTDCDITMKGDEFVFTGNAGEH